ncbi:MAG: DNA-binding protein [Meiothermus sp.]
MRVFLDANVLFSAALGGEVFRLIWLLAEQGRLELFTSLLCRMEAEFNLERKRPQAAPRLPLLMRQVQLVAEPEGADPPSDEPLKTLFESLPEKDRPVLRAALRVQAQILLTGDLRHFGPLMSRGDLPLRVLSPGGFIRQVRPGP